MSPRRKENKDIQDSTTEFFLKVIQKEKQTTPKDNHKVDSMNAKKTKTIETVGRFYNYINQTFDRILSNRLSVMFLSLLMAIILFMSISGGDILTSPTSGTTLENVPVKVEGLDENYELTGVPKSVKVGLIGPSLDIYTTKLSKNYEVYIDVKGYSKGEHNVSLKARNFPDTLEVMLVPDTLKVKLAPKVSQTFALGYRFINEDELDQKYSISVEHMAIDDVTLRGSRETLDKIATVEACIDVAKKESAFEQDARIKAYDGNGKEVIVDIAPTTVKVKCDVASYSKDVAIKPTFIGEVAQGYQVTNSVLSQSTVTVYGPKESIDQLDYIGVDVNVEGLKDSTTLNGQYLKRETGINKFSTDMIDVTVEIEKVITKKFDNIPIKVLNNSKKNIVSFAGKSQMASVSVTGSEDKISKLTRDNIQATIDVDKLSRGTRQVNVKVAVDDEKLKIQLLSSSKITINIERN